MTVSNEKSETLQRLELALEASQDGLLDWDLMTGAVYFSPRWKAMLGLAEQEILPLFQSLEERLHEDERTQCPKKLQELIAGDKLRGELRFRLRHQNGSWRWMHLRVAVRRDESGQARRLVGVQVDITDSKQVEAAMLDTQTRYRTLYDNAQLAFVLWNRDGVITGWNRQAEKIFGWTREERFGSRFVGLFPDAYREQFETKARELIAGTIKANQYVSKVLTKSGDGAVVEWNNVALKNARGVVSEVISLGLDMTRRQQAEEELQSYQFDLEALIQQRTGELAQAQKTLAQILEDSPVPIFVLDRKAVVTHWNAACESAFGIAAEALVGSKRSGAGIYGIERPSLAELVIAGVADDFQTLYGYSHRLSALIKGAHEAEIHVERIGRRFAVTAAPLYDHEGEISGVIETLQDITESKQAQQLMLEAKQLAESAAKAKADFLANMSHEIRTPMNAIIGLSHIALKTGLDARQREYIEKIHGAGTLLLGLVNDVLDISKIEAGMLSIEQIDYVLDEVLTNVATLVTPRAQQKSLPLDFIVSQEVPRRLTGDPLRLTQILVNLVGNAIKFTETGRVTVDIQCRTDAARGLELLVRVIDTGIGMTQEQAVRLFKAFSQADTSTTRKFGGTGLGLIICKKIIEQMGGEIRLESEAGKGSTFSFTLVQGVAEEADELYRLPEGLHGAAVLLADDDPATRLYLTPLLEGLGMAVTEVDSGSAALAELDTQSFAVAFVDWIMPGFSGVDVARHVAGIDHHHRPRLVMISVSDSRELEIALGDVPIDGILSKPIMALQVVKLLREMYGHSVSRWPQAQVTALRLEGVRILLVDDIATNQMIARELLESCGAVVEVADDGLEAVSKVMHGGPYDVVLMDLHMPRMDGLEATQRIRADSRFASLPIIAMTAHTLVEERDRCRQAGMNDFISKPVDPAALYALVSQWTAAGISQTAAPEVAQPVAVAEPVAGMPLLPGIDTAAGLRRMMNKPAFYEKVLRDFYARFRNAADEIGQLMLAGQFDEAERHAHSAKGLAATIGASTLHAAAEQLELLLKQKGTSPEAVQDFSRELEVVLAGLRAAYGLD